MGCLSVIFTYRIHLNFTAKTNVVNREDFLWYHLTKKDMKEICLNPSFVINKLNDSQIFVSSSGLHTQILKAICLVIILLLMSRLIALWSENMFCFQSFIIETCFVAQHMSIFINVPCVLEKNVYSAVWWRNLGY